MIAGTSSAGAGAQPTNEGIGLGEGAGVVGLGTTVAVGKAAATGLAVGASSDGPSIDGSAGRVKPQAAVDATRTMAAIAPAERKRRFRRR